MYVTWGRQEPAGDLLSSLLACHERIRGFVNLAVTIGERPDSSAEETMEASLRCERYFREALPLHVADEESSILPRLRGKHPDLDAALETMHSQHAEHEPLLAEFLEKLRRVHAAPGDAPLREPLRLMALRLRDEFGRHLSIEEEVIFPGLERWLDAAERAQILAEIRQRRD
ncbi:MAG: hypothetical protein GMKNLPBB_00321 [Myxococcota bacterium]|nr:hypothetical protein [Myxococcota bacterium]